MSGLISKRSVGATLQGDEIVSKSEQPLTPNRNRTHIPFPELHLKSNASGIPCVP
jgi:hypothetical protein